MNELNRRIFIISAIIILLLLIGVYHAHGWERKTISMLGAKHLVDKSEAAEVLHRPKVTGAERIFKIGNIFMIEWSGGYTECVSMYESPGSKHGPYNPYNINNSYPGQRNYDKPGDNLNEEEENLKVAQGLESKKMFMDAASSYSKVPGYEEKTKEMYLKAAAESEKEKKYFLTASYYLWAGYPYKAAEFFRKRAQENEDNGNPGLARDERKQAVAAENGWNGQRYIDDWWKENMPENYPIN